MSDEIILETTLQHNNFRKTQKNPSHVLYKTKNVQDANGNFTDEKVENIVKLPDGTRVDVGAWIRETKTGKQSVYIKVTKFNEVRPNVDTSSQPEGFKDLKDDIPF